MESLQGKLEKQIQNFTDKSKMIHHRQQFLSTKKGLVDFISGQGVGYDEFMNDSGKQIVFIDESCYGQDGIRVTNNLLVREFIECLVKRSMLRLLKLK